MTPPDVPDIKIPVDLLPADGRFGCGPSKVRPEAVAALAGAGRDYLGTSHRQATVQFEVGALRNGLAELFALPDGYEVLLGNGGTTAFWDAATFGLIDRRSQHLRFGEFSSKFAEAAAAAPFLDEPSNLFADPAPTRCPWPTPTSTPTASPTTRRPPAWPCRCSRPEGAEGLVLVDATSAAGGLRFDPARSTSTTSPPRSAWPPTGACGWPPARRPPSSASSGWPPRTAGSRRRST